LETGVGFFQANLLLKEDLKKMEKKQNIQADTIAFGFDRATDERSFELFLLRFVDKKLMETLLPRLQDEDILAAVDFLTGIMKKHLSEKEYHSLFLAE
jgi:hypothetical protein